LNLSPRHIDRLQEERRKAYRRGQDTVVEYYQNKVFKLMEEHKKEIAKLKTTHEAEMRLESRRHKISLKKEHHLAYAKCLEHIQRATANKRLNRKEQAVRNKALEAIEFLYDE
jgi:acyl-CoA reductase-like NAD-dependent aldehyde dehydrogenase